MKRLIVVIAVLLAACEIMPTGSIVGSWERETMPRGDIPPEVEIEVEVYTFRADGRFETYRIFDGTVSTIGTGTYAVSGNSITIDYVRDVTIEVHEEWQYLIVGNSMTLANGTETRELLRQ